MSCGRDGLRAQHLMDCLSGASVAISDELVDSITQVVNLFLARKFPAELGEYIVSAHYKKTAGFRRNFSVGNIGNSVGIKPSNGIPSELVCRSTLCRKFCQKR